MALTALMVLVFVSGGLIWLFCGPHTREEPYVFVEDDGSVREVTADEAEYLREEFLPGDGDRPHIKGRYNERTPVGSLRGFLPKRKLPRHLKRLTAVREAIPKF